MPRSPAYEKYPEHTLRFDEERVCVRVLVGETLIAESRNALNLHEGRYPATLYLPREDVLLEKLAQSDHSTHCPFKGDATYFDFVDGATDVPQVAWSYENPFDQMLEIRDHLAFYSDRALIERFQA